MKINNIWNHHQHLLLYDSWYFMRFTCSLKHHTSFSMMFSVAELQGIEWYPKRLALPNKVLISIEDHSPFQIFTPHFPKKTWASKTLLHSTGLLGILAMNWRNPSESSARRPASRNWRQHPYRIGKGRKANKLESNKTKSDISMKRVLVREWLLIYEGLWRISVASRHAVSQLHDAAYCN